MAKKTTDRQQKGSKVRQKNPNKRTTSSHGTRIQAKNKVQASNKKSVATRTGKVVQKNKKQGFPVVAIGASAGGLEALEALLNNMPADTGMAFVIVTHQHPGHISLLPELLGKDTGMPVIEAANGTRLEPNHVYVGAPGCYLAMLNGTLHRMETEKEQSPRLPIDYFFRSLAEDQKERAICIVLSGTGTDGTLGVKAIKGESGMAMAQQPQSAKYAGMPSSAIATGLVDYVLVPDAMPKQLIAYARGSYLSAPVTAGLPVIPSEPMQKIFVLLRNRTGHDFSAYKSNTLQRRIERRMNVHQLDKPEHYIRYLQENPHEIDILFKELLITVTNFFRDKPAWEALDPYLEKLVKTRPENYTLRAWVPGCATGEEVFSLAIALRECMNKTGRLHDVQIFGTDLDAGAIDAARAGQYPDGIAVDIPPQYLDRYFVRDEGTFRVRKEIREMNIFAPQNVIKDPPFTKLDMLFCRNLLIYLNADLQKKLLQIFHYVLKPGGLMFLGPSETIGNFNDLFEPLNTRWKIYRRKENAAAMHMLPEMPAQPLRGAGAMTLPESAVAAVKKTHISTQIERLLLGRFAPASLVVNEHGDIIYIHGHTGSYLEPTPGEPRHNVLDMARQGLQIELAAALRECIRKNVEVTRENIRVKLNGNIIQVHLTVTKIHDPESVRGLLLITLRTVPPVEPLPVGKKRTRKQAGDGALLEKLEQELQYMKESHQSTLEELETSNEELKSTNEELQSTNEELQSANEELETSKEEMQSLNEELTTVNAELQSKLEDLSQANDDMQNLLNSTDIATVFLDSDLNIKRFTEQSKELVMLRQTDIGRPISELASNLTYDNLLVDCRAVLKTLVFREAKVETHNGGYYLMRIVPYRTAENVINGLVLTFVNIGILKQAELAEEQARVYFENIVDTIREPLLILNRQLRIVSANHSFYRVFNTTAERTEGELIYKLGTGQWDIPKLRKLLEEILPRDEKFEDFEVTVEFPGIGRRIFILNARRLEQLRGEGDMILLALQEKTNK